MRRGKYDTIRAMRTTLDIPDAMYRRIKTKAAQEGSTVRAITLVLYSQWLGDEPRTKATRQPRCRRPGANHSFV